MTENETVHDRNDFIARARNRGAADQAPGGSVKLVSEEQELKQEEAYPAADASEWHLPVIGVDDLAVSESDVHDSELEALRFQNRTLKTMVREMTGASAGVLLCGRTIRMTAVSPDAEIVARLLMDRRPDAESRPLDLDRVVSKSGVPYYVYESFLSSGKGAFSFRNDENESIPYEVTCLKEESQGEQFYSIKKLNSRPDPVIWIRTFGYFEIFLDGKAIHFSKDKSKEYLALLVDRKGGFVTSGEAISCLWEDEMVNSTLKNRYRKAVYEMKQVLSKHGILDILEKKGRDYRIRDSAVKCDLYEYLDGKYRFGHTFRGYYMQDYSWAETTLAALMQIEEDRSVFEGRTP